MSGKRPKGEHGTITITAPKAHPEDGVMVENYRKRPSQYEPGVVTRYHYTPGSGWTYDVRLERKSGKGYPIDLTVGDDGISYAAAKGGA